MSEIKLAKQQKLNIKTPVVYLALAGLILLIGSVLIGLGIDIGLSVLTAPGIFAVVYGCVASVWIAIRYYG